MARYIRKLCKNDGGKLLIYIIILLLISLDQLIKYLIVQNVALNTGISLIDNIISLFYIQNNGAAWGILSGNMILFYFVTIAVIVGMLYWYHMYNRGKLHWIEKLAYILIFSGALGNFIDRIRLGYVIDMIKLDFIDFPIFNVADTYLTCGVVVMLIYTLFLEKGMKNE